jgi:hypothetical protein
MVIGPWKSGIAAAALLGAAVACSASPVNIVLNHEFSGATPSVGNISVQYADIAGGVRLSLTGNLVGSEHVKEWYFNADVANPATLGINAISGVASSAAIQQRTGGTFHPDFKADGDGFFDFKFVWANGVFTGTDTAVFDIIGAGVSVATMVLKSWNQQGGIWDRYANGLYTAAHVGGIGPTGADSGWMTGTPDLTPPIPLPSAGLMGLAGMIGLGAIRRRR